MASRRAQSPSGRRSRASPQPGDASLPRRGQTSTSRASTSRASTSRPSTSRASTSRGGRSSPPRRFQTPSSESERTMSTMDEDEDWPANIPDLVTATDGRDAPSLMGEDVTVYDDRVGDWSASVRDTDADRTQASRMSARPAKSKSAKTAVPKSEADDSEVTAISEPFNFPPPQPGVPRPPPAVSRAVYSADKGGMSDERVLVLDQEQFDRRHGFRRINLSVTRKVLYKLNTVRAWKHPEWIHFLKSRAPILNWLATYNWREDLIGDIIGGLLLSILYIPQGLAYGLMAGLPPIYGIYTGILGPFFYVIFGTSRHASTGGEAILSLMVGGVVAQAGALDTFEGHSTATTELCCADNVVAVEPQRALSVVALLTFYVGVIQLFLGFLHAGLLAVWLSDQMVEGIASGAAFLVLISQVGSLTGVTNLPSTSDYFCLVKFFHCFAYSIRFVKRDYALCSAVCLAILFSSKCFLDYFLKCRFKFPIELILVVVSTVLSYHLRGPMNAPLLEVVGEVHTTLPTPSFPDFWQVGNASIFASAWSIALVSFVVHISLSKLVAKEFKYQIDTNQEWLALGVMHIIGSFFGCFVCTSSLTRTVACAKLGSKSQLSTVVVCILLIVVAFGAAPLFHYLPKAVLSSILVAAMKDLYCKIFFSFRLFQRSIVDFLIFLVAFSAVVLINLNVGIVAAVVFGLLTVVLRSQWAESTCMGTIPGTANFTGIGHYRAAAEIPGIKIFRFDAPLYFANAELFLTRMYRATGVNPVQLVGTMATTVERKRKVKAASVRQAPDVEASHDAQEIGQTRLTVQSQCIQEEGNVVDEPNGAEGMLQLTHIIADCSSFPYIDLMGVEAIIRAHNEYKAINIVVFFACCKVAVRQMFEFCGFYEVVPKSHMFVSLSDAVEQAIYERGGGATVNPIVPKPTSSPVVPQPKATTPPEVEVKVGKAKGAEAEKEPEKKERKPESKKGSRKEHQKEE